MTNHVHLLASARRLEDGLSRMMQHLGRRFVQHVNHAYRRSGTLWEGRYKASLVDSEQYFLRCCRYIELNPVRAGMVKNPSAYRWSSYRHHAFGITDRVVSTHEQYARLGRSAEDRQLAYRALFRAELDGETLEAIRDSANRGWPLGSERFKGYRARAEVPGASAEARSSTACGADAAGSAGRADAFIENLTLTLFIPRLSEFFLQDPAAYCGLRHIRPRLYVPFPCLKHLQARNLYGIPLVG